MKKLAIAVTFAVALNAPAYAATKTINLLVSGMTCAACPITVKKALGKVEGVGAIEVNYETKEAIVTYDDTKTNVEALTKATEGAGYPSAPKN